MTKTNHLLLGFGLFAAACGTNDDSTDRLPSASLTPHTRSLTAAVACGDDIALYGAATPDLRYTFTYNSDGYMTHADGVYTAGGANDTIDYSFDSAQLTASAIPSQMLSGCPIPLRSTSSTSCCDSGFSLGNSTKIFLIFIT